LYIQNLEPDRWSAGSPTVKSAFGWKYGNIDLCPSLTYLKENQNQSDVESLFSFATSKHPSEELFDIVNEPACQYNLIYDKKIDAISLGYLKF
jgi:N-sulfoglucosamine sulfohydrolase